MILVDDGESRMSRTDVKNGMLKTPPFIGMSPGGTSPGLAESCHVFYTSFLPRL
jgi:hypothetical protein